MANQNPTGDGADDGATTAALDLRSQATVLVHVLTLHPAHLRRSELVHEAASGSSEFSEVNRFQEAIIDLVGTGLLFEIEELVLPTRAAIRFHEIFSEEL